MLVPLAWRAGVLRGLGRWTGPIVFMALVQVVVPFLLITYGERHIASSLTGILVSAAPIFTALIAVRYDDDERPHGIAIIGVVMGIVGVVLLFGIDLSGDSTAIAGGLMVLLASVGYAIGSLYLKHRLQAVPAIGIAASTMLVGLARAARARAAGSFRRMPRRPRPSARWSCSARAGPGSRSGSTTR